MTDYGLQMTDSAYVMFLLPHPSPLTPHPSSVINEV